MAQLGVVGPRWRPALALAVLWLLLGAMLAVLALAAPTFPELTGRVVDQAGLLSAADKAQLETDLAAFEAKSTDQIVVVTVPSLQGYPIDEFGTMLGRAWGIGQKGKDNGVLVLIAPIERKVRIEVGRRLEPLLPDGRAGSIIRGTILPAFRRGDFPGGIKAGVAEVKAVLEGDKAELAERAKRPPPPVDYSGYIILAIWLLIVIFAIRAQQQAAREWASLTPEQRRARQKAMRDRNNGVVILPGGFGSGSGGWSGGSGGSGGGGGFSGGGGDFGGGGASGDW
jgi:uncharacterized protein